jgi:hypothetical protein
VTVFDLDSYRERRNVRRAAAAAVSVATIALVVGHLRDAWGMLESGIRLAGDLLPDDDATTDEEPPS